MRYFAYDDKMFSPILEEILPGVQLVGAGCVRGYRLYFHNRDLKDQSGKCNLVKTRDKSDVVYGVIYDVVPREKHRLDKSENLGYGNQETTLKVERLGDDNPSEDSNCYAFTYIAHKENVFEDLVPFTWYKQLVVNGAIEHKLPEDYIHHLQQVAAASDPNAQRENQYQQLMESKFSP